MERDEILKSVGFSDKFLNALNEFDKAVPNVYYEVPFIEYKNIYTVIDTSGQLIINRLNDNYNSNVIVRKSL